MTKVKKHTTASAPSSQAPGLYLHAGALPIRGRDDGQGAAARFDRPVGVVIDLDAQGNLFVGDSGNGLIRRITPDGAVSTVAGTHGVFVTTPGPLPAALNGNGGIAVDQRTGAVFTTAGNAILRVQFPPSASASTRTPAP